MRLRLAKRLAALADYVPAGAVVADIGTDHAYLPIFLIEAGISNKVIATDLRTGPLAAALRTVEERRLGDCIELRLGDGLQPLAPGDAEVLVLAGMGGKAIKEILTAGAGVLNDVRRLVMQPMSEAGQLRIWLVENNWKIVDEKLICEGEHLYQIVVAEPGRELFTEQLYLELGPRLIESKDPLLEVYLERIIARCRRALKGAAAGKSSASQEKARLLQDKLERLKEVAKCL